MQGDGFVLGDSMSVRAYRVCSAQWFLVLQHFTVACEPADIIQFDSLRRQ